MTDPTTNDTSRAQGGLQRGLTTGQISMIGLSGALGTGLFLGSGSMIKLAGPAIILSYTLTGLLALIVIWALAEMTTKHPVAGGFGASAQAYLGPLGGFLTRWNSALVMCIAVGAEVTAGAAYLRFWWPELNMFVGTVLCSAILVAINLATVKFYGASEYWFSMIKVVVVLAFILLGIWLLFVGTESSPAPGLSHLTMHGGFAPNGTWSVFAAAILAIFSFGGAENVSVTAAESQNPEKDIPKAANAMIFRLIIFYVGAIAIVVALQPWTVAAGADGSVASSPFVSVLNAVGIRGAASFMNFILIVAALSAGNGCLYASARMYHSLGNDRLAPQSFGKTTSEGAPRVAVMVSSLGMAVAALLALFRPDDAFQILFGVLVFGLWLTWFLIMVTYLAFRITRSRLGLPAAPVQLIGGRITGGIGLGVLVLIAIGMFFIPSISIAWTVGGPYLLILGIGYALVRKSHKAANIESVLDEEIASYQK
ncbi:MAG: amino acid permease [Propionibacteriaceae bacterium]